MKVLVTGATGFLGKYIIDELMENGYEIIAMGRNEEIGKFIKEYTIVEFRDFKPIKDFDMIKMTLEEWNNLKKWKKLEVENNIIEIEEKDFEKDVLIYRLNGRKINAKIEVTDFVEIKNNFFRYFNKWFSKGKDNNSFIITGPSFMKSIKLY